MEDTESYEDFIQSISPDVVKALKNRKVFEALDDTLCPATGRAARLCQRTHEITIAILQERGIDPEHIPEAIDVLNYAGGHCDCEVLYNVADENRLRAKYWTTQVDSQRRHTPNG